jgi:acyl-CoA thioester hydrolase
MKPASDQFFFWHEVGVRFKDIDVGGHAHHSLVLVFFEEARAAYWREVVGGGSLDEVDFILAEARVRYHARILYPLTLRVGVRVSKLGKKHFVMEYLVEDPDGEALASGETVMVMFDYQEKRSKAMSPEVSNAIREKEGGALAS